jgi:hypothetical protein
LHLGAFFHDAETIWSIAIVFNDISEWETLPRTIIEQIAEIIAENDLIQQSYKLFRETHISVASWMALASLTSTVSLEKPDLTIHPYEPIHSKLIDLMLFLLDNAEACSVTFSFWLQFAEDQIIELHTEDKWLQQALIILIEKSAWTGGDDEEVEYRRQGILDLDLLETICEALGTEKTDSFVNNCLDKVTELSDLNATLTVCIS